VLVDRSIEILSGTSDLGEFGRLLHEAWEAKRSMSNKISSPAVDEVYELARANGALGGKLLGAGGGGFLLLFVPPQHQAVVRQKLAKLIHVPFEFEYAGSQIIFFDREEDYAEQDRARATQPVEAFRELAESP
jgi:D-glycero-alpha-D-manno-heptose-7-phosphate kinase